HHHSKHHSRVESRIGPTPLHPSYLLQLWRLPDSKARRRRVRSASCYQTTSLVHQPQSTYGQKILRSCPQSCPSDLWVRILPPPDETATPAERIAAALPDDLDVQVGGQSSRRPAHSSFASGDASDVGWWQLHVCRRG